MLIYPVVTWSVLYLCRLFVWSSTSSVHSWFCTKTSTLPSLQDVFALSMLVFFLLTFYHRSSLNQTRCKYGLHVCPLKGDIGSFIKKQSVQFSPSNVTGRMAFLCCSLSSHLSQHCSSHWHPTNSFSMNQAIKPGMTAIVLLYLVVRTVKIKKQSQSRYIQC